MDPIAVGLVSAVFGLATAGAGLVAGWISQARNRRQDREFARMLDHALASMAPPTNPLDDKLARAVRASEQLATLTGEITEALDAQVAETKRLQADAAEAKAFMSANEEVVVAMRAMLRSELREELKSEFNARGRSDKKFQIGLAIVSFVVGIGGTILFQIIWTALTTPAVAG